MASFYSSGCKGQVKCFTAIVKALVETYARDILNENSDILGTGEIVDACKTAV